MPAIDFSDPVAAQVLPELMAVRRAFPVSQDLLAGPTERQVSDGASIGWHDTEVCTELGAVAVVPPEGEFSGLVGDVLVVKHVTPTVIRGVYVYVVGTSAEIVDDLSLGRRAFLALALLSSESLTCSVGVVA